ncbi:MAG TPA: arginase family protein [Nitrososphaeraceae archaeon]|nr:arginase family protein [Nitrososphaeraceae archaeon]
MTKWGMEDLPQYTIIDAPSVLGLRPTGVEHLPEALKAAGLLDKLHAKYAGCVRPSLSYNPERGKTLILNANPIRSFSLELATAVGDILDNNQFPVVLGGDCSILIGIVLSLRRCGRYGLFFIDGHADFYQPQASTTGEVADMDLAIVSGRGPDILTNIDNLKPLVRDEDVVVFGYRDAEQSAGYGGQDVKETNMHVFDLLKVRELKIGTAASLAVTKLLRKELAGFWIHLDADVLDDRIMPAVDYRLDGGLGFSELSELLRILVASTRAVGISITIFNPHLDGDGSIAKNFVSSIDAGLRNVHTR